MKQGDTKPFLRVQLVNPDGSFPNLTGSTVKFRLGRVPDEAPYLADVNVTVIDAATGIVEYRWTDAGATALVGEFIGEFRVTESGGAVITYPGGDEYVYIKVGPSLSVTP